MKANWIRYKAVMHLARIATMALPLPAFCSVSFVSALFAFGQHKNSFLRKISEYSKVTESESPIVR